MKKLFIIFSAVFILFYLQGCLAVETKEYSFRLKSGNSGEGKIKFINIMRSQDSLSNAEQDYQELVNSYLNGYKPEDEMLGVKNVKKRLFEEDNRLCGEITFEFDDITTLKFYDFNNKVWSYYIGSSAFNLMGAAEKYFSSNGTYAGDNFPVIFWESRQKEFEIKTSSTEPSEKTEGLLEIWKQKGGK
jgi:hypothetical protein